MALSEKYDVYSFGVVLLELITGKTANSGDPEPYLTLAQFVSKLSSNSNSFIIHTYMVCE